MGNTTSIPKHLQRSEKTNSLIVTFKDYTHDAQDDGKITREVGALQMAISEHVRDYYHDRPIQHPPEDIANCAIGCINEFGFGDPQVILTEGEHHEVRPSYMVLTHALEEEIAFMQWRAVTAHLCPKIQKGPGGSQVTRIDRLAKTIDETTVNFYDSAKDSIERLQSLRNIVEKAAIVGEMIFASSSRWNKEGSRPEQQAFDKNGKNVVIVLFPALVQMGTKDLLDKMDRGEFDVVIMMGQR
ncbi:uncharacterized protein RCO7_01627 [Rhynchosporium graminicola]|uniref:Uncharacterized protein n=1 Tax=Rhynchosporium graminicola TaxID=2792576 RepID=A0A1E1KP48_9HELO|nr:uncharacterized protein RCO7_01627 [Rhynchosporium commune]